MSYDDNNSEPTNAEILAQLALQGRMLRAIAAHVGLVPDLVEIEPAGARELDSEWGNPEIKFAPKNWSGEPVVGRFMSDLQPTTLRALATDYARLARYYDEQGSKDNKGRPKSYYARKDAGRALGWALRLESQGHRGPSRPQARREPAPNSPEDMGYPSDDDVPF